MTANAKPMPGHKLAGTSFGVAVRCECGWGSSTWYGKGARHNALGEWSMHKDAVVRAGSAACAPPGGR